MKCLCFVLSSLTTSTPEQELMSMWDNYRHFPWHRSFSKCIWYIYNLPICRNEFLWENWAVFQCLWLRDFVTNPLYLVLLCSQKIHQVFWEIIYVLCNVKSCNMVFVFAEDCHNSLWASGTPWLHKYILLHKNANYMFSFNTRGS